MGWRCLLMGVLVWAQASAGAEPPPSPERSPSPSFWSDFHVYPELSTVFPFLLGGGVGVSYREHFQLGFQLGLTPKPYSQAIGAVAAELGGNTSYREVIEAAYQNNFVTRFQFQYHFHSARTGWRVGLAFSMMWASGSAGIDQVLGAVTGYDYTSLKNLLVAAGRDPNVTLTSRLLIGEIHGGYAWELYERVIGAVQVGVAKILWSQMGLQTGLSNFEATQAGYNLLRSSESDLESILIQYGYSPTVGISVSYEF